MFTLPEESLCQSQATRLPGMKREKGQRIVTASEPRTPKEESRVTLACAELCPLQPGITAWLHRPLFPPLSPGPDTYSRPAGTRLGPSCSALGPSALSCLSDHLKVMNRAKPQKTQASSLRTLQPSTLAHPGLAVNLMDPSKGDWRHKPKVPGGLAYMPVLTLSLKICGILLKSPFMRWLVYQIRRRPEYI